MLLAIVARGGLVLELGELVMILDLHRQGLSVSAIARQCDVDRKTVRKYIERGLEAPAYGPRKPRARVLDDFTVYLRERVKTFPGLTGSRLLRELKELGYQGGYTAVTDFLRDARPTPRPGFEVRFETGAGEQGQVDFAHFQVVFTDEPTTSRVVWLFSMVLGYSRLIWGRFVIHQDLATVLRCHVAAFEALGGAPREILYDRMKTAVTGEGETGGIIYNAALIDLARHYGFHPRACKAYRAKTKGKVERPFRYIREDFFLGRSFKNLEDLNAQLRHWLDTVANSRVHATTRRVVNETFAEERAHLRQLPLASFRAVLRLERRISRDGMISVGGNFYSVPDATRRRAVEVHTLANEVHIFEDGALIATHLVLEGRHQRRLEPGHRKTQAIPRRLAGGGQAGVVTRAGDVVVQRPLGFYDAVARRLAQETRA
jgi:transposase